MCRSAFAKSKLAECVGAALKPTEVADGDVASEWTVMHAWTRADADT